MANLLLDRVLTLDLRSRRFGYVIFEGPQTLLDWGIKIYGDDRHSWLEPSLKNLRSMFSPSIILVRRAVEHSRIRQPMVQPAFHNLKVFAKRAAINVLPIDASSIHSFFSKQRKINKHDIAQMIADRFPELSWRLPPKRKPWQSEPTRQSIFDAASLGVFYFSQKADMQETAISPLE